MSTVEKCFTVLLVLLTTALQGQTTEPKRSERYAKAYVKYLGASCQVPKDSIQHFVYFARDRELIKDLGRAG